MRVARPRRQSNRHIPVNLYTSMTDQEKRRETEIEMYPCHYIFSVSSSLRLVLAYAQKLTPNKNILNTAKYSKGLCRYGHRHTVLVMTERNYTRVSDKSQYTHFLLRKILHCLPLKVKKMKKKNEKRTIFLSSFLVHSRFLLHLSLIRLLKKLPEGQFRKKTGHILPKILNLKLRAEIFSSLPGT